VEPATRTRLISLAVLVAVFAGLIVIATAGGGSDGGGSDDRSVPDGLRLEATSGGAPELVVYVEDPKVNRPATTGGATSVVVECIDNEDTVVFTSRQPWPFTGTDAGTLDPHVHMPVDASVLGSIVRCSLNGTDPVLEGGRPRRR
jgi:hypothetical protein